MGKLEDMLAERDHSATELLSALDAADDEITPPQTVGREILDWMEFTETGLSYEELPKPTLWRVLVFPKQPKTMSRGGIALPSAAQSVEAHLNYIGQVVAMGPLAGWSWKFWRINLWTWKPWEWITRHYDVKIGDWVTYGRYAGQKTEYKCVGLLTSNDDDITNVLRGGPGDIKVYL